MKLSLCPFFKAHFRCLTPLFVAASLFLTPTVGIFSPISFAKERPKETSSPCSLVQVVATQSTHGRNFIQYGQGWVFKYYNQPEWYILTPAHVVAEAQQLKLHCPHFVTPLTSQIVSQSKTLDLAVLKISTPTTTLSPLFLYTSSPQAYAWLAGATNFEYGIPFIEGGRFNVVAALDVTRRVGLRNTELVPYAQDLLLGAAVRPGMSGSLIVSQSKQPFPLGMITKTKINDHYALGIPMSEIFSYLPALVKGSDPWSDEHPHGPFLDFESHWNSQKRSLERIRILRVQDKKGILRTYREQCPSGTFKDSSNWMSADVSGGSIADATGGSIADATNNGTFRERSYTGASANVLQFRVDNRSYGQEIIKAYYKETNICTEEGLRDSANKIVLGVNAPPSLKFPQGVYFKLNSTTDLFKFIETYPNDWSDLLDTHALVQGKNDDTYDSVCRTDLLGPNLYASGHRGGETYAQMIATVPPSYVYAATIPLKPTDPRSARERDKTRSYLTCPSEFKNRMIEIRTLNRYFAINLFLKNKSIAGAIYFLGDETLEKEQENLASFVKMDSPGYWRHYVTTPDGYKFVVELSPTAEIASLQILEVPEKIKNRILRDSRNYKLPFWLINLNWEIQKDGIASF